MWFAVVAARLPERTHQKTRHSSQVLRSLLHDLLELWQRQALRIPDVLQDLGDLQLVQKETLDTCAKNKSTSNQSDYGILMGGRLSKPKQNPSAIHEEKQSKIPNGSVALWILSDLLLGSFGSASVLSPRIQRRGPRLGVFGVHPGDVQGVAQVRGVQHGRAGLLKVFRQEAAAKF